MDINPAQDHSKQSFASRLLIPSGIGAAVFFALFLTYYTSWYVENRALHFLLTDVVGALYGVYLLFHAVILYPILYSRGASLYERIFGTLLVTCCWLIKEVVRMTEFYSLAESVFYLLMPTQASIVLLAMGFMAVSELICRRRDRKAGLPDIRVMTPGPVFFLLFAVAGMGFILRRGGHAYFFDFYALYRILFL
jgi:hypothetical protein